MFLFFAFLLNEYLFTYFYTDIRCVVETKEGGKEDAVRKQARWLCLGSGLVKAIASISPACYTDRELFTPWGVAWSAASLPCVESLHCEKRAPD